MINLVITAQPKSAKYLEFSQTLEQIKGNLQKLCTKLTVIENKNSFTIVADLKSNEQLSVVVNSKEISILSGAIKILCEKSKIMIKGSSYSNKTENLKEIRLRFKKTKQSRINQQFI